jgi:hypothetical protein
MIPFGNFSFTSIPVYAAEGTDYLSEEDVQFFTMVFLKEENDVVKALYSDVLAGRTTDYDTLLSAVNKVEKYWNIANKMLPSSFSSTTFSTYTTQGLSFIGNTINILKNISQIKNDDKNALQTAVDSMQIICSIFSICGITLPSITAALAVLETVFVLAEFFEDQTLHEAAKLYEANIFIDYCVGNEITHYDASQITTLFCDHEYAVSLFQSLYLKYTFLQIADSFEIDHSEYDYSYHAEDDPTPDGSTISNVITFSKNTVIRGNLYLLSNARIVVDNCILIVTGNFVANTLGGTEISFISDSSNAKLYVSGSVQSSGSFTVTGTGTLLINENYSCSSSNISTLNIMNSANVIVGGDLTWNATQYLGVRNSGVNIYSDSSLLVNGYVYAKGSCYGNGNWAFHTIEFNIYGNLSLSVI